MISKNSAGHPGHANIHNFIYYIYYNIYIYYSLAAFYLTEHLRSTTQFLGGMRRTFQTCIYLYGGVKLPG